MKIGVAFGDHIKVEKNRKNHSGGEYKQRIRVHIFFLALVLFPLIIILKLLDIQLIHGSYYRLISESNRTKTNTLFPQRGAIFDRKGNLLVINSPSIEKEINEFSNNSNFDQNDKEIKTNANRYYPYKETMAHVLGYIGKLTKEELSEPEYSYLHPNDSVGKSGIEKYYDNLLRGTYGKELVEVDALGNTLRTLGSSDPIPGQNIQLTLDKDIQKASFDAFPKGKKGAVIVSNTKGEILALVSMPSFDPNLFTMGDNYKSVSGDYKSILAVLSDDSNQPFMDRAISGVYPPGSTFKLVTAAAGLEKKIIDKNYIVEDTGVIRIGEFSFGNWYFLEQGKKDGQVDIVKAISRSNDIFFYKLAEKISVDKLSEVAHDFGVGSKLEIDLPNEASGLLPTKEWKSRAIKEPWYLGDTFHYGIGQGFLLTTPMQVNSWTGVIANQGLKVRPHLLKESESIQANTANVKDRDKKERIISESAIDLIRRGMIDSCKPGGVAWPLFNFRVENSELRIDGKNFLAVKNATGAAVRADLREVSIACKTGTAQHGGEETLPHAWITLFAPAYNPQIVVTVLIESAGQGSNEAGPVAKKVLETWFKK